MDNEVQKINDLYLARFNNLIKPISKLSHDSANNVNLINNATPAFDFDKIKKHLTKGRQGVKSVDALYFNNYVNFIEFKRGYKPDGNNNFQYLENMKLSGKDSLLLHLEFISTCDYKANNQFVAVVNSGKDGRPSDALASLLAKYASSQDSHLESALQFELKKFLTDVNNFDVANCYSSIKVWNDMNFDYQLQYDS